MPRMNPLTPELKKIGLTYNTYKARLKLGWSHEMALTPARWQSDRVSKSDLDLIYAMLDDRNYHLAEADKLTAKKIGEKMGLSEQTIHQISAGIIYGRHRGAKKND